MVSADVANTGASTATFRIKPSFRLRGLSRQRGRNYVNAFTLAPGHTKRWTYTDHYLRQGLGGTPIVRCAPFVDAYVISHDQD